MHICSKAKSGRAEATEKKDEHYKNELSMSDDTVWRKQSHQRRLSSQKNTQ